MELNHPFSISSISFILFLIILFKLLKRSTSSSSNTNLPPGPWTLPLIGNLHQIGGSMPHHSFRNLASNYGPLMHLKLGEVSHIIVTSPEIAELVMKTHDLNFCDRTNPLLSTICSYNATGIASAPYGEYWRQLRKICTMEMLSAKRVQSFRSIREEEVSEIVKAISASDEGSVVNLSEKIFSLTYGIVARVAFGKKNRHQVFKSAIEEQLSLMGGFCVADLYPSLGVLQGMSKDKVKMEKMHREVDRILQDVIDDHRNEMSSSRLREAEGSEDLVDVLLRLQKEQQEPDQYALTDDNLKAVIQDMFAAGGETISEVVLWVMSEMVRNPKVMEEAQAEVRRVFDTKGDVDETEMHQLIYLKCVIKETMRLHPPLPFLVPRECRERCEINGYEVPAKSRVNINVWAIGRDPKYWDEAETFKPGRFLNSQIDFRGTNFEYLPFGAGRRICPGIAFALPNIELPLAKLLYHFDWKLPNGMKNEEIDMTESFGLTLSKVNDLCLIPITRRQHL
ncbi:cytochrome P450 71D10-like [Lotus japonicus]|uniref:cytochrome P450 71D10-like n=1 Tax=Lotus japonicus TaxID=34305 RepID=UPI0025864147|nr:cytochrome P450 71D10-like [Lotus japonicus]